jgi:signal transduction histidine kinase
MNDTTSIRGINELSCIFVSNRIITKVSHSFIGMTDYLIEDFLGNDISEVFKMLRFGPSVNLENIDKEAEYFLFTKSLEVKFVHIDLLQSIQEMVYIFSEIPNSNLDTKIPFAYTLCSDNYYGIGIYSMPDMTLLKTNEKYISFKDEPYNKKENCIGKNISEFATGFKGSTYEDIWDNLIRTGKTYNIDEYMYEGLERGITYWRLSLVPIYEQSKIKYCVVMTTEITEQVLYRKKIEEQAKIIKKQKKELETVLDNMMDGFSIIDTDGNYTMINKKVKEWLSIPQVKSIGDSTEKFKYYDLNGKELTLDELPSTRVLRGEKIEQYDIVMRSDNYEKYISISGAPIYDDTGNIIMGAVNSRDITDRVKQSKIIEGQKKQLEAIVQNVSDGMFLFHRDKSVTFINDESRSFVYNVLEYNKVGDSCNHTEYFDRNGKNITLNDLPGVKAMNGERIENFFLTAKRPDKTVHYSISASPLYDDQGNIVSALLCSHDITELVNNQKKLLEQKEQIEAIIENMSDLLCVFDADGNYVLLNEVARRAMNSWEHKNIGDYYKTFKCFNIDAKELLLSEMPHMRILNGEKIREQIMYVKTSEETKYFGVSGAPLFDVEGKVNSGVLCIRNITVTESKNQIIKRQKEELEAVIENISDAIFIYDSDNKLYMLNKAARDYFPDDNIRKYGDGYSYTKFFYFNDTEIPSEEMPFTKIKKGQVVQDYKAKMVQGDTIRYINVSGRSIFDADNNIRLSIVRSRDITEDVNRELTIKEQQELLLKREIEKGQALMEAMALKDEFLYLITHEFRTPMAVVNSALQLINSVCKDEISEKLGRYLGIIKQNTNRQLRLVNNLLDITRMSSGNIRIHRYRFDVVYIIKTIVDSVQLYAQQKDVNLSFYSTLSRKYIYADEEKLERIVLNLLSNALKFTSNGKGINVTLSTKKRKNKNMICICVQDEGIGIPEEKQQIIFERFGQADTSLSRRAEGTGLGLHLVKLLVNALGGEITLKSEVNAGSTFTVMIPASKEEADDEAAISNEINCRLVSDNDRVIESTTIEFSDIYF